MRILLSSLLCLSVAACARAASMAPTGDTTAPAGSSAGLSNEFPWPDAPFVAPTPHHVVHVPGEGEELANRRHPLVIELASLPADLGSIDVRRLPPTNPDRLSLEIRSTEPIAVREVVFGGWHGGVDQAAGRTFYLDLPAFIGYYELRIGQGDSWRELAVPATSIALDGPQLFLNGDQFLSKGALILWGNWDVDVRPTAATSFLLKNFGLNTVLSPPSGYYEKWGMASIQRAHSLTISKATVQSAPRDSFLAASAELVGRVPTAYHEFISSPMNVASFFSNETTNRADEEANARSEIDQYGRLNSYLARMHNAAKEVSPMMPTSYASHTPGFRPVPWLDILMYNSYYPRDRYNQPLDEFAAFQGYPAKPLYHKEFSANTYLDQIYQGGGNNPVFGKIRQWAFSQRWQDYMEIGSLGGGIYTAFDYKESTTGRDGNTTAFGFLTAQQQPKLVAYGVWKEYLDLVFDDGQVTNRRPYALRDISLLILGQEGPRLLRLDSLAPGARVPVDMPESFTWIAQFDTHGGLLQQQMGAYPETHFQRVFASLLPEDESTPFLQRLLPTEVIGWDGGTDRYLMGRFKNDEDVIAVALQRAPGEYYLTAWVQKNPPADQKADRHTLTFFDVGEVRLLDDVTGEPLEETVEYEVRDGSLVFPDLALPRIGRSIRQRSDTPIRLPVIEVSRSGFTHSPTTATETLFLPDQFQLGAAGSVALGDGTTAAVAQRFVTRNDNLRSFGIMPLADVGRPAGSVTVRLHVADDDETPGQEVARRVIGASEWQRQVGGLLRVDLPAPLDPERSYLLVLSARGDAGNHRTLATAGFDASAVTPSYGAGELLVLREGAWRPIAAGNESLFFVTFTEQ